MMTITQLNYIVAVDDHKSFAKAAEKCYVTQPTLSMQIKKLEENLGVQLFDRRKKPVLPTAIGRQIIEQARISLTEVNRIQNIIKIKETEVMETLRIGIIPTISPYLVPLFISDFKNVFPNTQLVIKELVSEAIAFHIYNNDLDMGIMVTPNNFKDLVVMPLYYEPFVAYAAANHHLHKKGSIVSADLDLREMWLLEEGYCFRNQMLNICGNTEEQPSHLKFDSGSLETIRRIVERQFGYTLLPALATAEFNEQQRSLIKTFKEPQPIREVSLVMSRRFIKRKVVEALKEVILKYIPAAMKMKKGRIIKIDR